MTAVHSAVDAVHEASVDVIIAVHDSTRPVQRAIDSLQEDRRAGVSLTVSVVCHNISVEEIRSTLTPEAVATVRWLELHDGIRSAAGPFNHGIAQSTSRYVTVLGSDDYLEPGAIAAWVERAERAQLDAVIAPERHASGRLVRTPPLRPRRIGLLDGVRDRLAYRTAPLGLLRRAAVHDLQLRFTPALATGDDQEFTARLWFSGARIAYAHGSPRYVVGDDARSRVTLADRPMDEELRFVAELIDSRWFGAQPVAVRAALAIKMTRVHLFSAASRRVTTGGWTESDARFVRRLLLALRVAAPAFERPLSLADRRVIDAIEGGTAQQIARSSASRRRFGAPTTLITRDVRGQFAVEGPIRFMLASALLS